ARQCKAESNTFTGICIAKPPCRQACIREKFTDGHCSKVLRRCLCTKRC
uniref:NoD173 defensin n=1 Tax=Nicotiana occidentalis TaxID=200313 RepID=A0A4V8H030_9SOLA|nr:Chain A, NoD173 defensin [Nicotiana occidentalis]6MRY_B Chain B, NoD173 defensin [Nicotiana occidentalis]6MRY_C Chain C, NoD173 defensin [Nicotiana occidentalis]6MRY_D Chain D, NoD173 defensin [Nicotiana occidentalis]6MRY_E Chain E, NoD173 defensin [Nicotiana occidentalis]6MRY_F Chain F, NoD173 defensin [Nicotiana occidentalis]6MRY_G Chain G, NoD173 defensin [Nicotiana occidentalis]6MRY_H Chain H, NoD173 defensin [Nicotiana occidentalis]6MRY_I Chain I, NoD173 defensin [Nicotiana occident